MNINNIVDTQATIQKAGIEQQQLRNTRAIQTAPEGATVVKPQSAVVEAPSVKSRYVFAIGEGGQKYILRLQIDLSSSKINMLA